MKVENVNNGVYCASGTQNNLKIVEETCDLLDETPPEIVSVTKDVTTNTIKIYINYKEEESYIAKYEYRISKGNENIANGRYKLPFTQLFLYSQLYTITII